MEGGRRAQRDPVVTATLLVEPADLDRDEIRVIGDAFRHLFRARRLEVGEPVRLVDGRGRARRSRVSRVARSEAVLEVGREAASREPDRRVELVVGALRPQRASWMVEKATELGVAAVRFVSTERAPRRFGGRTLARLTRMARSAVEQSGRSRLPEITGVHPWGEIGGLVEASKARWILEPGHPRALRETPAGPGGNSDPVVLVVGPEGGFTEDEKATLAESRCRAVGLGARTLRVETAAVAGLSRLLAAPVSSSVDTL